MKDYSDYECEGIGIQTKNLISKVEYLVNSEDDCVKLFSEVFPAIKLTDFLRNKINNFKSINNEFRQLFNEKKYTLKDEVTKKKNIQIGLELEKTDILLEIFSQNSISKKDKYYTSRDIVTIISGAMFFENANDTIYRNSIQNQIRFTVDYKTWVFLTAVAYKILEKKESNNDLKIFFSDGFNMEKLMINQEYKDNEGILLNSQRNKGQKILIGFVRKTKCSEERALKQTYRTLLHELGHFLINELISKKDFPRGFELLKELVDGIPINFIVNNQKKLIAKKIIKRFLNYSEEKVNEEMFADYFYRINYSCKHPECMISLQNVFFPSDKLYFKKVFTHIEQYVKNNYDKYGNIWLDNEFYKDYINVLKRKKDKSTELNEITADLSVLRKHLLNLKQQNMKNGKKATKVKNLILVKNSILKSKSMLKSKTKSLGHSLSLDNIYF